MYILSLFSSQVPTFWAIGQYTISKYCRLLLQRIDWNAVHLWLKTVFCENPHPTNVSTIMLVFVFGKRFAAICLEICNFLALYTLASLNYSLSFSEHVTTNVTAQPVTLLHGTIHGCTVVSHMCSCNAFTVTRK